MDAIETLMSEHRLIEAALDGLVGFADAAAREGRADGETLGRFVQFFRAFADACHHGKEEDVLFRSMAAHGFPSSGGPLAVMLHEHAQGRALVGALAREAAERGPWTAERLRSLADTARAFAALLAAHIQKEDGVLYPMAEQHLPPAALAEVGAACARLDGSRAGELAQLRALGAELAAHAPADRSTLPTAVRTACGGRC